jgi:hypothetical protein
MSGSAFSQRVRKSLAIARAGAASAFAPFSVRASRALARATPRYGSAAVQQFHTIPLWSRIFRNQQSEPGVERDLRLIPQSPQPGITALRLPSSEVQPVGGDEACAVSASFA